MTIIKLLKTIFLTPDEPRLRSGWRLIVQGILIVFFTFIFALPSFLIPDTLLDTARLLFFLLLSSAIPATLAVMAARKWIDRRSLTSLGLIWDRRTANDLITGIGIALAQIGLIFIIEWSVGWLEVSGFAWQQQSVWIALRGLLLGFAIHLVVGFYEELLSRGYQLQNLEEGLNTFWAVVITSAIFGIGHLFNPNASWTSTLGIFLAGIFLAYGYLRTRQLWLPIGLHIGWNFFLGPVFGFPVSGLNTPHLLLLDQSGPDIMTGGAFGPEAGVVVLPALALGTLLIWLYSRGRLETESTDEG
jgi:membrane protease YdiL (CAAX protease family)